MSISNRFVIKKLPPFEKSDTSLGLTNGKIFKNFEYSLYMLELLNALLTTI